MRVLLDTHALIWFQIGSSQLSVPALDAILDTGNQKLISPASFWEIAIKVSTRKYLLNLPYADFIQKAIYDNNFTILPIEPRHATALIGLLNHHKDPFDRLLIAQAIVEDIPIVSADGMFDTYPITRIW